MGSFILRAVRPANIQAFVSAASPASLRRTPRESWRAYLLSMGATGQTLHDLENSVTPDGKTLQDSWAKQATVLAAVGTTTKEKARNAFK